MLPGKWDTDDRYKKDGGKNKMHAGSIEPTTNKPDNITKQGEATGRSFFGNDFFSKRPDHDRGDLEALKTPGNSNNCQA